MTRKLFLLLAALFGFGPGPETAATAPETILVEVNSPLVGADGMMMEDLGIETLGGAFTPLIAAGTKVPRVVTESFTTAMDGQEQITLTLYRGRSRTARQNHRLGQYAVSGLPRARRGVPQVEISFQVSERKQVLLSACDRRTGQPLPVKGNTDAPVLP